MWAAIMLGSTEQVGYLQEELMAVRKKYKLMHEYLNTHRGRNQENS
jgi:hypothetical protein